MSSEIPTSMKALLLESFGPAEALKYTTVPMPKLNKPSDVLIRVVAVGVNPIEAKLRGGNLFSFMVKKNAILGADFSGIIVAKGKGVDAFAVGDAVFGTLPHPAGPHGTYAEYIVMNTSTEKGIAKKPANVSFAEAAGLGIAALTALVGVVLKAPLPLKHVGDGPRPKVLVIGASGGVGIYGIQIAKAIGAHVVGICSSKNAAMVTRFGADHVVDYNDSGAMAALRKEDQWNTYDVVFDAVGGDDYYNNCISLVKKRTGVYVSAVGPTAHFGSNHASILDYLSVGVSLAYRQVFARRRYSMVLSLPSDKIATDIVYLLEQNLLKTHVPEENIFTLEDGYKAHQKIESHRTVGKIVLNVSPNDFTK